MFMWVSDHSGRGQNDTYVSALLTHSVPVFLSEFVHLRAWLQHRRLTHQRVHGGSRCRENRHQHRDTDHRETCRVVWLSQEEQHSTAQHSTAQHRTEQNRTEQNRTEIGILSRSVKQATKRFNNKQNNQSKEGFAIFDQEMIQPGLGGRETEWSARFFFCDSWVRCPSKCCFSMLWQVPLCSYDFTYLAKMSIVLKPRKMCSGPHFGVTTTKIVGETASPGEETPCWLVTSQGTRQKQNLRKPHHTTTTRHCCQPSSDTVGAKGWMGWDGSRSAALRLAFDQKHH